MILLVELALTIYGIVILIRGKYNGGKDVRVTGTPARVIGLIFMCTLPLAFLVGFSARVTYLLVTGRPPDVAVWFFFMLGDIAVIVFVFAAATILSAKYKGPRIPIDIPEDCDTVPASFIDGPFPEPLDPSNPYASPESRRD